MARTRKCKYCGQPILRDFITVGLRRDGSDIRRPRNVDGSLHVCPRAGSRDRGPGPIPGTRRVEVEDTWVERKDLA